ncbi:MAG TPA: branched-chain amino acid ABC transporter substrate-binding protein, partial [Rubrivivax sp.]|nr:branched-chain amino acid ABC transporter substrate-binding protein [Rubrivivax sp.]
MKLARIVRRLAQAFAVPLALVATQAQAQEPIRVGAFLAITGPASFLGDPENKTLEMLVEQINAAGGLAVDGQKRML